MATKNENLNKADDGLNSHDDHHITEELYKRNLELAVVNKTLFLLRKLYQISLLTLEPLALSEKISNTVRLELNLEVAGVFIFDIKSDSLSPLAFSMSDRLSDLLKKLGTVLKDNKILNVSSRDSFQKLVYEKTPVVSDGLLEIWDGLIAEKNLEKLTKESHTKTTLMFPLVNEKGVMGVLLLGLNREYETLSDHEKDSITSIIDVVAIALDKAYLYKDLQDANDKLKTLDKLKTEFLSLASHQLRSPLTSIKGYTSMLMMGDFGAISDKQKEAISHVFDSSVHLTKVVEDLLSVSKIEQGGMQYVMLPFDFEKVAKDLALDLSIIAQKKGLTLTFETDVKSPYVINGDMEKIRQVILNLMDNSIKYTKEGGLITRLIKDEKTKKIRWSVTDTGMGLTENIIETLFQKFSRGQGGKMNTSGSGLGLYLAKQIVGAHKGHIWVESKGLGKGATFYVEFNAS